MIKFPEELFRGLDVPAEHWDVPRKPRRCSPPWPDHFCRLGASTCKAPEIGDRILCFPVVQETFPKMDVGHPDTSRWPPAYLRG